LKIKKKLPVALIAGLFAVVLVYLLMTFRYQNVFLPHTTYSGISIAGKTPDQANQLLQQRLKTQKYQVKDDNKTILSFTGSDLDINHDYTNQLKQLKDKQNPWAWTLTAIAAPVSQEGPDKLNLSSEKAQKLYDDIIAKTKDNRTMTENATIVKKDNTFSIKKEVYGTNIDEQKLKQDIQTSISEGKTDVDLKSTYAKPTILSDNAKLQSNLATIKKIAGLKATYQIANDTVTIPSDKLSSWLTYNDGKIQLDEAGVKQYVSELNTKYSTIGKTRDFKTTAGTEVKVPAGTYGWSLKVNSETAALSAEILKGQDFTRKPLTQGFGYNDAGTDIGNTYVEVSKSAQHMWVYKDGKQIISTDVVTGKPGQDTPSGVFVVWNKVRNTDLKGTNDDGTPYSSPVSYWMPIDYTGVGLHDSSWQPQYGGSWYVNHGSHGCVNTPPSVMSQVYADVAMNTPVIVY
jgi:hypothetical protein